MISVARAKFVRISPRKVRYVIDLIRNKSVREAEAVLAGSPRRAGEIVSKLLKQALDAAKRNSQRQAAELVVSRVMADGGPSMKRFRAASMGRAGVVLKRTSHITLELDLKKGIPVAAAPKAPQKHAAPSAPKQPAGKKPALKKLVGAK